MGINIRLKEEDTRLGKVRQGQGYGVVVTLVAALLFSAAVPFFVLFPRVKFCVCLLQVGDIEFDVWCQVLHGCMPQQLFDVVNVGVGTYKLAGA